MPDPALAYREVLRRVRARDGRLGRDATTLVQSIIDQWSEAMGRVIGEAGTVASRREAALLAQAATGQLHRRYADLMEKLVAEGRDASFEETLRTWESAQGVLLGHRGSVLVSVGEARIPPVLMLNQYAQLSAGRHWKTILRSYWKDAGEMADGVILRGFTAGVGPDELSRRLRAFVDGAEDALLWSRDLDPSDPRGFRDVETVLGAEAKIDLRRGIPKGIRDSARLMRNNARRIAFSEWHNARAEAEVQAMIADPYVQAVRWSLSPNRGVSFTPPDVCDMLAGADWYGLGNGVYPVNMVPPPPHPYDRCERLPITRATKDIDKPKPTGKANPGPFLLGSDGKKLGLARGGTLTFKTPGARKRALMEAERALAFPPGSPFVMPSSGPRRPPTPPPVPPPTSPEPPPSPTGGRAALAALEAMFRPRQATFKSKAEARNALLGVARDVDADFVEQLSLKHLEAIFAGLATVLEPQDVKLVRLGFHRRRRRSLATYFPALHEIQFQETATKKAGTKAWARDQAVREEWGRTRRAAQIEKVKEALSSDPRPAIAERLRRLEATSRWTVTGGHLDLTELLGTAAHEAGHAIHYASNRRVRNRWGQLLFRADLHKRSETWYRVSEYGATDSDELFAEIAAALAIGEGPSIPEELLEVFLKAIGTEPL